VVGLIPRRGGTWAQRAAIATSTLAAVPDAVTDAQAAALPTAGLTALRMLEVAGLVLGKRVLVTGATGGLGRLAVQLAHRAGAGVTTLVRDRAAAEAPLRSLGADEVIDRLDEDFDVILEGVGGATFAQAIEHLAPGGVVVNVATQDDEETVTFRASRFDRAAGARIYTLNMPDEITRHASGASDLRRLCALVADGRLDTQVTLEESWRNAGTAIDALLGRRLGGKAVLHVD
jgi:NADPH:quinone reductase-like Zn-dependent oxidoreductase